jgi:hypothetical protein
MLSKTTPAWDGSRLKNYVFAHSDTVAGHSAYPISVCADLHSWGTADYAFFMHHDPNYMKKVPFREAKRFPSIDFTRLFVKNYSKNQPKIQRCPGSYRGDRRIGGLHDPGGM